MSKRIDGLENDCKRDFGEAFSLFDAIEKSAERYVMAIEDQKIQAVNAMNKAIEAHNKLEIARAKRAVEFAKKFDELDKSIRESNETMQKLYEKLQKTYDILCDRVNEALGGEDE